ncbi:MAG: hypothetical protein KDN05_19875, partial [Verrucomicrobiae bacterium]|nr:hypothetical protein [Verrucomicrobiae bacterium]
MIPFPSPEEDSSLDSAEISAQIEAIRPALRGYILSILPHPDAVEDVVQETCLFLWERRADFQAGTNFKAWAFKTGYFKALAHRRALQRNKIITFSEDVLHRIAGAAEQQAGHADARLSALSHCLRELGPADL